MILTIVIGKQMKFMQEKNLGFDKEQVMLVERGFNVEPQKAKTLIEEIRQLPEVMKAAGSFAAPGREGDFFGIQFQPEGSSEILTTKTMIVADGLIETLGLELVEGKGFSEETNDSLSLILNERAVKVMGLENPIGKKLVDMQQGPNGESIAVPFIVKAIVKDFNFISLREEVTPLVLQSNEAFGGANQFIVVRVKPGQIPSAITSIESKWKTIVPDQPFKFSFLDENLNKQYQSEQQTGRLFAVFSGLAIFVACIGLFALSAYVTSLRTKEIGVRKVLGASVTSVVILLSKDFTRMILIAFVLAAPAAWYVMENWWLQNFAYRIQISLWIIVASGAIALLIAWLTVSYQSIKAATKDPVRSLRYE
jgi:putative ABC transport system permease protein